MTDMDDQPKPFSSENPAPSQPVVGRIVRIDPIMDGHRIHVEINPRKVIVCVLHQSLAKDEAIRLRVGSWCKIHLQEQSGEWTVRSIHCLQEGPRWQSDHPWSDNRRRSRLLCRFEILQAIQSFFMDRDYAQIETPVLSESPGLEPFLDPFETTYEDPHRTLQQFLPYSPEYAMKKMLAMGFGRIFQIAHAFRNGECSRWHMPEFLMLEWYRPHATYHDAMDETESLICYAWNRIRTSFDCTNRDLDLTQPWPRSTYADLFLEATGIEITATMEVDTLKAELEAMSDHEIIPHSDFLNTLLDWAFLTYVEPRLPRNRPMFIYDYPLSMCALAKVDPDRGATERFELFIGGLELANGYSELTDPAEHSRRFEQETWIRQANGKTPIPLDPDFLNALAWGIPPSAGVALGVDRLVAVLTGADCLADVIPLPFRSHTPAS